MFEGLDDAYPLTPLQQGMLYESLKRPDSDVYVAYILIDIVGNLDKIKFFNAWRKTHQQFETLRTRFVWEELDEPLQLVESEASLQWVECTAPSNLTLNSDTDRHAIVDYWLEHERSTPLSLTERPPTRLRLVVLPDGNHVLLWTVHHLLADDWSTPLVQPR